MLIIAHCYNSEDRALHRLWFKQAKRVFFVVVVVAVSFSVFFFFFFFFFLGGGGGGGLYIYMG